MPLSFDLYESFVLRTHLEPRSLYPAVGARFGATGMTILLSTRVVITHLNAECPSVNLWARFRSVPCLGAAVDL